jgi:hypothetical protein|tara:strand:+ start:1650 stop:1841 length:192 start_codon:yes stop_codon:yes gene_type:complete
MAKNTHPLELAFMKFDETTQRMLKQVSQSFGNLEKIPEVKQPQTRKKKQTIYSNNMPNPFGGN